MGATPEDTEREIERLRGDMTAAVEEVERRLRGGLRGIATAEARVTSVRTRDEVLARASANPTLVGVAGMVAAGAVVYGVYALLSGMRERQKPQNRLRGRVKGVRQDLSQRAARVRGRVPLPRGVLVKLEPEEEGYVRIADARLEPAKKKRGQELMIKKFVWAILLSIFMALGSVLARRVADSVWRAMIHEEPPTEKSKAAS
jgi:hypothetical protein